VCGEEAFAVVRESRREKDKPIDLRSVFRSSGDEPLQEQLVRCAGCGLCYVRPRLKWGLILGGYQEGSDETFVSQVAFREATFERCLDGIESRARPQGRRVLDVGAAGGSFLAVARKRGYQPLGCEPSRWMCDFAREQYGLELLPGTLFDLDLPPGSIDLLTLFDVIEHTPDPTAVVRRAHDLLAPGGVLAITYPDYDSLAARIMGPRWVFLLTVHLYYFGPRTMRRLLERAGFAPVGFSRYWQTLELGYVVRRAAPYLGPLGGLVIRLAQASGLARLPFRYWVGQTLVVATKA
jgi:SAM-dependent methyltransferase